MPDDIAETFDAVLTIVEQYTDKDGKEYLSRSINSFQLKID